MTMESPHWFVRNRLKTRQLWLIVAIHEYKSINKAAEALGMTQPAASRLLREIEEVLDVSLFERLPRGMQATWYGETMVRHARMVLRGLNTAWDEIAEWKSGRSGRVAIGSIMAPSISIVPHAIKEFHRGATAARVSVLVGSSDVLMPQLALGEIDIMIGRFAAGSEKKNFDYEPLVDEEPLCFLAPRGHPLLRKRSVDWSALAQESWVVPPRGSVLRHRFEMIFRDEGVSPPARLVEAAELQSLVALVQGADMLTILPTEAAQHCTSSGMRILPIPVPCTMDAFGIIIPHERLLSPSATRLLDLLREAGRAHYGDNRGISERAPVVGLADE